MHTKVELVYEGHLLVRSSTMAKSGMVYMDWQINPEYRSRHRATFGRCKEKRLIMYFTNASYERFLNHLRGRSG